MTSQDINKPVKTPDGVGILQGVAEIPDEGTFVSVIIGIRKVTYFESEVSLYYEGPEA